MDRRVLVMAGDVGVDGLGLDDAGESLLASCHTVIHSAATVSFDSPLDSAVEINLLGPVRMAATLNQLHADERPTDGGLPHLIAVSTAYVAGSRRGRAPEATLPDTPWSTEVAWRPEVEAARRARGDADADSRDPKLLARFQAQARQELGAAGTPLLAAKVRTTPRGLGQRPSRQRRQGPGQGPGMARRLRLHQVAGRTGPARVPGRAARHDRAAVDHRIGARRARTRMDPRIPNGRPGDHLLRQGPPAAVSRRT